MPFDAETARQAAGTLGDLVDSFQDANEPERDAWLGNRASQRVRISVPVWIQTIGGWGPSPAHGYELCDISASGLGFISKRRFEPGQWVLVELCANNAKWSGRMRVVHCTDSASGYIVGLELNEPRSVEDPNDPGEDSETHVDTSMSLDEMKGEIRQAMRAYELAYRSWGLLAMPLKRRIRSVIKGLVPATDPRTDGCRREHGRLRMEGDVHLVLPGHRRWRATRARVIDVSEDGVGLLIEWNWMDDQVERELAGEFRLKPQMPVLVGLGAGRRKVWTPGEISYCASSQHGTIRLGVKFNTAGSQEAFGA